VCSGDTEVPYYDSVPHCTPVVCMNVGGCLAHIELQFEAAALSKQLFY
jgi:hypothetical protein